jgi:vesicle-fusing ATPase
LITDSYAEWTPIGSRFSNAILQALLVLMGKRPPKGRRLLIIATTSIRPLLTELQMADVFDAELRVPPVSSLRSLEHIVREVKLFPNSDERRQGIAMLEQAGFGQEGRLNIGIKKLLSTIEMARQEPDATGERLTTALMGLA